MTTEFIFSEMKSRDIGTGLRKIREGENRYWCGGQELRRNGDKIQDKCDFHNCMAFVSLNIYEIS